GDPIDVSWRVRNQGEATTNVSSWVDRLVLSADDLLDNTDAELAQVTHSGTLAVDTTYTTQTTVTLPNGIAGDFHIFVVTDFTNVVSERDAEDNNTGRTLTPITVTLKPSPDLQFVTVTSPADGQPDQAIAVGWTVSNAGPGLARGPWIDRVFLSSDGSLNGATLLASVEHQSDLSSGEQYSASTVVTLPEIADGTYTILVQTDATDAVYERDGEENNLSASGPLTIGHADLSPAILSAPSTGTSGTRVPFQWSVTNTGTADALGSWVDRIYLSSDQSLDASDRLIGELAHAGPLAKGANYTGQLDLALPVELSGPRFVLLQTDAAGQVTELDGEN